MYVTSLEQDDDSNNVCHISVGGGWLKLCILHFWKRMMVETMYVTFLEDFNYLFNIPGEGF